MDSDLKRQLDSLVADLIDERLDESRREQLNFLLRDSDQCRSRFHALMDVQCSMADQAGLVDPGLIDDAGLLSDAGSPISSAVSKEAVMPSESRSVPWVAWSIALASLAALLLLAIRWPPLHETGQSKIARISPADFPAVELPAAESIHSVVRVSQASAAEYYDGGPTVSGQTTQMNREYVLTSGMVMLSFPSGAEAIIEGPSVFSVTDVDRLLFKLGRCSVHAPKGAEGFRVDTPQTRVIDLGTRFCVDVNDVGQTEVQVIEGAAEVHWSTDQQPAEKLLLTDGQAGRFGEQRDGDGQATEFETSIYRRGLPDRIVRYRCVESTSPVTDLASVTVQRGGRLIEYSVDELIGVEILHFVALENSLNVAVSNISGALKTDAAVGTLLESDRSLATGLINPGGSAVPLKIAPVLMEDAVLVETSEITDTWTPGIGLRFKAPIVNGPGPDVVLFELQSKVDSPTGDGFHVSPLQFSSGLRSHTVKRFDIAMKSSEAMQVVSFELPSFPTEKPLLHYSLSEFVSHRRPTLPFCALAVGIDLSNLGYADGALVSGLFIQDDANENRQIDPVFIAGFPALIEDAP